MIYVYRHARERWVERIDPNATLEEAHAAILAHSAAITKAAAFGARRVRLPNNAVLGLSGADVITVLRHDAWKNQTRRQRREIRRKIGHK